MTIQIKLRKKPRLDGLYPIVLRIYKGNHSKVITLNLHSSLNEWNESKSLFQKRFKQKNLILEQLKKRANDIILDSQINGIELSISDFEKKFRGEKIKRTSCAIDFFKELQKEMILTNRTSNAKIYRDTIKKLTDFAGKDISFETINVEFLEKWEVFLRSTGHNDGGLSVRYRTLRAMFNKAIRRELVDRSLYPFDKFKVAKFKSRPHKRALSIDEFLKIKRVELSAFPELQIAKDLFLFSFYCAGMNFIDISKLKKEDINGDRLIYRRSKTGKLFNLVLSDSANEILEKYLELPPYDTSYVFPILLKDDLSERQIFYRRDNFLKRYNRKMKKVASIAGVETKVTSYVARHTMATLLKYDGCSIEEISEVMGHSSVKVTMEYLKAFGLETMDGLIERLDKF